MSRIPARRTPNAAEPEPIRVAWGSGPRASGQTLVRRARIRPCPGSGARSPKPQVFAILHKTSLLRDYAIQRRAENTTSETGRSAIVRLQKADPFLEPGREFIFLARFDGVRGTSMAEGGEDSQSAVASLIDHYEPLPLVME